MKEKIKDVIYVSDGIFLLEDQAEFWKHCGVCFEIDAHIHNTPFGTDVADNLRKHVPRDVAVVTNRKEEEGRVFEDIYLVYCRRGRVYVYKAF